MTSSRVVEDDIAVARRWFAEELRHIARIRSSAVVQAFATVPREHFAGPGPWRLLSPWYLQDYWTTEDADPRHLCHDVLGDLDNGRPTMRFPDPANPGRDGTISVQPHERCKITAVTNK